MSWPCPSARSAVSQRCATRAASSRRASSRNDPVPCRKALGAHIAAPGALYRDPKSPPLSHDTIFVSRPTLGQAMRARAAARPVRRPAVSWPHLTVSQALLNRIVGPCCEPLRAYALACHDTIHFIVTQGWKMASNPSIFPALFFFFHSSFFFSHSSYWKTTKKIYIVGQSPNTNLRKIFH